jgi:hypothetical protein
MATRKKASRKKAGPSRGRSRGKTAKRSAAKTAKRSAAKKSGSARRGSAARSKKRATKRSPSQSRARREIDRATRVARGVVEQATVAVVTGVDTLKGIGETIVDRVRGDQ